MNTSTYRDVPGSEVWCRIFDRIRQEAGDPQDPRSAKMIADTIMSQHGVHVIPGLSVDDISRFDHHLRGERDRGDWNTGHAGSDSEPSGESKLT